MVFLSFDWYKRIRLSSSSGWTRYYQLPYYHCTDEGQKDCPTTWYYYYYRRIKEVISSFAFFWYLVVCRPIKSPPSSRPIDTGSNRATEECNCLGDKTQLFTCPAWGLLDCRTDWLPRLNSENFNAIRLEIILLFLFVGQSSVQKETPVTDTTIDAKPFRF